MPEKAYHNTLLMQMTGWDTCIVSEKYFSSLNEEPLFFTIVTHRNTNGLLCPLICKPSYTQSYNYLLTALHDFDS